MLPYSFAHRVMVSHGAPSASVSAGPRKGQPPLKAASQNQTASAEYARVRGHSSYLECESLVADRAGEIAPMRMQSLRPLTSCGHEAALRWVFPSELQRFWIHLFVTAPVDTHITAVSSCCR